MNECLEEEIRAVAQRTRAEQPQCCALVRCLRIVERRRIEPIGGAHVRSIVGGSLAGGPRHDCVDTRIESQSVSFRNIDVSVDRRVIETIRLHRTVAIDDDQRERGVAAPIHRDTVLLDVVETEAPRSADQVEADRRLPGDDLPIAAFSDRPRPAELETTIERRVTMFTTPPTASAPTAADAPLASTSTRSMKESGSVLRSTEASAPRPLFGRRRPLSNTTVGKSCTRTRTDPSPAAPPPRVFRRARSIGVGIERRAGGHGQRLQDVADRTLTAPLDVAAVEHGERSHGLARIEPPAQAVDDHFLQRILRRGRSWRSLSGERDHADRRAGAPRQQGAARPLKDPDRPGIQELEAQPGPRQQALKRLSCRQPAGRAFRVLARHDTGDVDDLQVSLSGELAKRLCERLSGDVMREFCGCLGS